MKKVVFVAVILSVVASVYAGDSVVGSGNIVTDERTVGAFDAIDLRVPCDLEVTIGEQKPITITTDDNIAPLIQAEIKDGTLRIWAEKQYTTKNEPEVKITIPDLKALTIHGSSDVRVSGLDNDALAVTAHGSADLNLFGKTKSLTLVLHGSADAHAFDLTAKQAVVTVDGSADARITVADSLVATINGSGDLTYAGSPKVISTVHGSGTVQKRKS